MGRTLTSAWIETLFWFLSIVDLLVALSRVRGLKLDPSLPLDYVRVSHSHECVD